MTFIAMDASINMHTITIELYCSRLTVGFTHTTPVAASGFVEYLFK